MDYFQMESPTLHMSTWRTFLALAQKHQCKMIHIDVKNAFLHGDVEEAVYMKQPEGFEDSEKPNHVCKLNRALYGLKQAARIWNLKMSQAMTDFKMKTHPKDPCLYFKINDDGKWAVAMLFVDDIFAIGDNGILSDLIRHLTNRFEIKVLGDAKRYISINITRNEDHSISLDQHDDIEKMLIRFGMDKSKQASTPEDPSFIIDDEKEKDEPMSEAVYRSAIGSLFWFALSTRPDIQHAVMVCSQYQAKPTKRAWTAVKRIFRYLRGTLYLALWIDVGDNFQLETYTDASHGDPHMRRFSVSGAVHMLGNAPISWTSRKQKSIIGKR